jgi:hypothetical protein
MGIKESLEKLTWRLLWLGWGLTNLGIFLCLGGIVQGGFFRRPSKEEKSELQAAQRRYWSLQRDPLPGFRHAFVTLRNGLKLHYVVNAEVVTKAKNVAVFIHGEPSSAVYSFNSALTRS